MVQKSRDASSTETLLKSIHKGMEVHDSKEHKIGTVAQVYLGASGDETEKYGAGASGASNPNQRGDNLVDDFARAIFGEDDVPKEMRQRLLNEGFLRIDAAGLLAQNRYVLPEQIARVHENHVHLNIAFDGLMKT